MSTVVDYEPLIQHLLVETVETAAFPMVTYVQGRMVIGDNAGRPASILCHAEAATFAISRNKRLGQRLDRQTWAWTLELSFKGHVALGQFEQRLIESPPRILRDRAAGRDQQVTLLLIGSAYQPPPEGQPAGGMRATYRFNASLTPS